MLLFNANIICIPERHKLIVAYHNDVIVYSYQTVNLVYIIFLNYPSPIMMHFHPQESAVIGVPVVFNWTLLGHIVQV